MGQQQLLLVILVTIIVGIATVVAINTFGAAAENANIDAVRQDIATFASSAQGYFMKPEMLGGGGGDFLGITFRSVAFPGDDYNNDNTEVVNPNGVYILSTITDTLVTITAHPSSRIETAVAIGSRAPSGSEITADVIPSGVTNWSE